VRKYPQIGWIALSADRLTFCKPSSHASVVDPLTRERFPRERRRRKKPSRSDAMQDHGWRLTTSGCIPVGSKQLRSTICFSASWSETTNKTLPGRDAIRSLSPVCPVIVQSRLISRPAFDDIRRQCIYFDEIPYFVLWFNHLLKNLSRQNGPLHRTLHRSRCPSLAGCRPRWRDA
jgi:hypothetical protein